ncbi:hypothetical protein BDV11DRAFT_31798 [Aspergillus similis]
MFLIFSLHFQLSLFTTNCHTHFCCFFLLCLSKALLRRSQRVSPALCLGTAPTRSSELFKTLTTRRILRTSISNPAQQLSEQSKARTKQASFSAATTIVAHFYSIIKTSQHYLSDSQRKTAIMCSQYFYKFDCGCTHPEGDVVYCAKRGTSCTGVRQQIRVRSGFNCPQHGG